MASLKITPEKSTETYSSTFKQKTSMTSQLFL